MAENIIQLSKDRCQFCGKEATKLCDKVMGEYRWAGHPPRSISMCIHPILSFTEKNGWDYNL